MFSYTSIAELVTAAEQQKKRISELELAEQAEAMAQSNQELFNKTTEYLYVMQEAVKFGERP